MIGAGHLRERVTIQQATRASDGQGGATVTWATLATVWAQVVPIGINERIRAAAVGAALAYQVRMRYRADVSASMRISWTPYQATTAKTLEIHGVQPYEGGRAFLTMDCSEVV